MKRRPRSGLVDWPAAAFALGARLPATKLNLRALAAIRARPADEPVAIACSGGADSVALLLALWAHLPERRGHWLVLHFNHRLRGRAADGDAAFVRELAAALGERCRVGEWTRKSESEGEDMGPGSARSPSRSRSPSPRVSEAAARAARHEFFAAAMCRAGARAIALGHQRDDVAETMLMRLARGSGAGGLSAPRPVQEAGGILRVRPLLDLPAAAIREALSAVGAPWREDVTNRGDAFFRNRVRARVLPALIEASPADALAGLAAARAQLEDDDEALRAWAHELCGQPRAGTPFDVRALGGRPRALARRAVHAWLAEAGLGETLAKPAVERIVEAVAGGGELRASAGRGRFVIVRAGVLTAETEPAPPPSETWEAGRLVPGGTLQCPDGAKLAARRRRLTQPLFAAIIRGAYSPDETVFVAPGPDWPGWFDVRGRRPGDRYRPLGAPGRATIQNLLINRKIPRERRAVLPVVCMPGDDDGAIVWVPGIPPAAEFAVQPDAGHVVQLTYRAAGNNVRRSTSKTLTHARTRKA